MGLTERQQLERALRESREAAPPDALDAYSPCGAADEALTVSLAGGLGDAKAAVKPSRRERELASLAPWAWDPNVDKHRPGRAMMRDFTEVLSDKSLPPAPRAAGDFSPTPLRAARAAHSAVPVHSGARPSGSSVAPPSAKAPPCKESTPPLAVRVGVGAAAAGSAPRTGSPESVGAAKLQLTVTPPTAHASTAQPAQRKRSLSPVPWPALASPPCASPLGVLAACAGNEENVPTSAVRTASVAVAAAPPSPPFDAQAALAMQQRAAQRKRDNARRAQGPPAYGAFWDCRASPPCSTRSVGPPRAPMGRPDAGYPGAPRLALALPTPVLSDALLRGLKRLNEKQARQVMPLTDAPMEA